MPDLSENLNDFNDDEMHALIRSGYAESEMSAAFQEELLSKLDAAYRDSRLSGTIAQQVIAPALSGGLLTESHPLERRRRPLVGLKLAMTFAAAACLLLAVAFWNSQAAYGWEAMLRALNSCDWVQAISQASGFTGWVSSERGVLAVRDAETIAFEDRSEQSKYSYYTDREVIYKQPLEKSFPTASTLVEVLLRGDSGESSGLDWELVSESWRKVEPRGNLDEAIELFVTLRQPLNPASTVQLLFLLDPNSKLPRSARLLSDRNHSEKSFEFHYPDDGPTSIFAMGVPRETEVIASLARGDLPAEQFAQEAEARRRLASAADSTTASDKDATRVALSSSGNQAQNPSDEGKRAVANQSSQELLFDAEDPQATPEASKNVVEYYEFGKSKNSVSAPPNGVVQSAPQQEVQPTEVERIARRVPTVDIPQQPLPQDRLVGQLNRVLATMWQAQGVTPAEPASDTEFLRRVYLDLTGRIPMVSEVYDFLVADEADRREQLIEQLLQSRDHSTHLATVWRKLLLPDGIDVATYGGTEKFDQWLADRFEKNVPYDQLVRELLLAEGRVSDSGPILFYATLKLNPEELAAKTSRTFLGMRMECAQCHDHPFDASISQQDFWGFAAHFAQISRPKGRMEMTSSVLRVRDNNRGEVLLPDTEEVVPPQLPYQLSGRPDAAADRSRREVLVDWITNKQNDRFARATVNRVWQHLFGLGLVEPADDMRSDNPVASPEALDLLSLDFAASGYDLRRLFRTLALSEAYQLTSGAPADEPSQALVFARMNIKSLTADQLYDCISVATQFEAMGGGNAPEGALVRIGNATRQAFIEQFRAPPGQRTDYQAGIPQALTLMHGPLVHGGTSLATSGLLKSLNAPFFSDQQRIETLFLSTLSRYPTAQEQQDMLAHLEAADSAELRSQALGDILWALLNTAEFTFIH